MSNISMEELKMPLYCAPSQCHCLQCVPSRQAGGREARPLLVRVKSCTWDFRVQFLALSLLCDLDPPAESGHYGLF